MLFRVHLVHEPEDPHLNVVPVFPLREEMKPYRRTALNVKPGFKKGDFFRLYRPVPDLMPVKCF